jgi:iron complex transport system substrate-binding protein
MARVRPEDGGASRRPTGSPSFPLFLEEQHSMRTPQRLSATVLAALAALTGIALAGCSAASGAATSAPGPASPSPTPTTTLVPHWPTTVTAANGKVTIKSLPQRIVSLDPTATEDLYAVGAGPQVVAVDQDSDFPPGAPAADLLSPAASGLSPDIAAIAGYDPSLVIAQNSPGLVAALTKLGIPVLIEPEVFTLRDVYNQIEQIGLASGHGNQAAEVVTNMREEITDIVAQVGDKYRGMSFYLELSSDPYSAASSATLLGHIMDMFGLRDITASAADGGHPALPAAAIIAAKPQLIFLADDGTAAPGVPGAMIAARPGWGAIPAVKDQQVFGLNAEIASRWGPRLPQLIEEIASALASVKS